MLTNAGRAVWVGLAATAVLLTAACGSSSTSSSTSAAGLSAANQQYLQAQVSQWKAIPTFTPPGPTISVSSLKGKLLFAIPIEAQVPFVAASMTGIQQAAQAAGLDYRNCPNQGQPSQWAACIEEGISAHAAAIILIGVQPSEVAPQLAAAQAAGIPTIECALQERGAPNLPGITASVGQPGALVGQIMADYAILHYNGAVHALVVQSSDVQVTAPLVAAITSEFKNHCGAGCTTVIDDVPTADWATQITTSVQSALVAHPDINAIIPIYDGMMPQVLAGINGASASSRVKILTFNGTPSVLSSIASGPVLMDIGEPAYWLGWNYTDQAMRSILGQPLGPDKEFNAIRAFDASNVSEAGTPPSYSEGYGDAYVAGYKTLWGLSS